MTVDNIIKKFTEVCEREFPHHLGNFTSTMNLTGGRTVPAVHCDTPDFGRVMGTLNRHGVDYRWLSQYGGYVFYPAVMGDDGHGCPVERNSPQDVLRDVPIKRVRS